jgi:hypothetical protein
MRQQAGGSTSLDPRQQPGGSRSSEPRRRVRGSRWPRRDVAVALALALLATLAIVLAVAERAGGDAVPAKATGSGRARRAHEERTPLPPGWHRIDRPLTGVTYPRQVLAAATYPVELRRRQRGCTPTAALRRMPATGVLVQIVEYAPRVAGHSVRVPRLPRRPHRFSYADAAYGPFECAGPSYKFAYRRAGHALQAQVWMRRRTVDPRSRAAALRILDGFAPPAR